jgi:tetrahydromethanopterin S-methyltransferase subunit G
VASSQFKRAQAKARQEMKGRVAEVQARVTKDIDYAFESLLQEQPDLSLKMEGALEEVLRMAATIDGELEETAGVAELERLDRRIEFIEEQFEDIEAELYSRAGSAAPTCSTSSARRPAADGAAIRRIRGAK